MEVIDIAKAAANYGVGIVCLAVLVSLHIYNVKVSIPKAVEENRKQIDGLVGAFRDELAEARNTYGAELAAERRQCHEDHEKLFSAVSGNQLVLVRLLDRIDGK